MPISGDEHRREAVGRAAARWVEGLIELDRRNTLLHFRSTRTTTLDLGNADPDAFAALLAGRKKRLTELFRDSSALADAVKRVRTVRRRVRELDEEQGVQAGYLAHGFVEWDVPPSGQGSAAVPLRAPLLLYPISVHARTAAQVDFDLEIIGDVELNEILIFAPHHFLGTGSDVPSNGIALSELTDPDERLRDGFELVDGLARRHGAALRCEPGAVVGAFSYDKLPMVRDLQASHDLLASHDLIAALAGDEQAQRDVAAAADAPLPDTTPDTIPPADEFLVHSADASQQSEVLEPEGLVVLLVSGRPVVTELAADGSATRHAAPSDLERRLSHLVRDQKAVDLLLARATETEICESNGAYVFAVIGIGSFVEGLLYSVLIERDIDLRDHGVARANGKRTPLTMVGLKELVDIAHHKGWVQVDAKDFLNTVRDYRNFVHPRQQLERELTPDRDTVMMCWDPVHAVLNDLEAVFLGATES